jgi:hypothetical protein
MHPIPICFSLPVSLYQIQDNLKNGVLIFLSLIHPNNFLKPLQLLYLYGHTRVCVCVCVCVSVSDMFDVCANSCIKKYVNMTSQAISLIS